MARETMAKETMTREIMTRETVTRETMYTYVYICVAVRCSIHMYMATI